MTDGSPSLDRYSRQTALAAIGPDGQRRLLDATFLVVGLGALGSVQAQLLARAGAGRLRMADRDIVEENNLQRQLLYDEEDAAAGRAKADAAARTLRRVNSSITVEPLAVDVTRRNVAELLRDVSVVLDGTDNMETRYLLNDACVRGGVPWIYGGAIETTGMTMPVLPGKGPCLRCVFPEPPAPGTMPTCDTVGVLGAVPAAVAAIQVAHAIRIVVGDPPERIHLTVLDLWDGDERSVEVHREPDCPCCGRRRFDFLEGEEQAWTTTLCGRNAVQITPARTAFMPLGDLAERLRPVGAVSCDGTLLRFEIDGLEMMVFADGRAIVRGTTDEAKARGVYARYIGA